jgi:hypothetical protein
MTAPAYPDRDTPRTSRLRQALERELRVDETVQWYGWQLGRTEWRSFGIYIFAIPWTAFSLMWTAFAASATWQMDDSGAGWLGWAFPLFGLPFIAVGLGMLAMPFAPVFQRGRVLFVVTGQRVLKLALWRDLVVTTVPADRIGLMERREQHDGTGSLKLAIKIGKDSDGDRQTEHFELGEVEDVIGAQAAIDRIAATSTAIAPLARQPGTLPSS